MPRLSFRASFVAALAASLACGGSTEPEPSGRIRITAQTTGTSLDATGYAVSIDGAVEGSLSANGEIVFDVSVGSHAVLIQDVDENCRIIGDRSHTVTVADGGEVLIELGGRCVTFTHPDGSSSTTVPLGGRPYHVAVSWTGVTYAALIGSSMLRRGNLATMTFGPTVEVGSTPPHVVFTPDQQRVYATLQYGRGVAAVDVGTNESVAMIPLIADGFNLIASADGSRIYATDAAGWLYAIDPATNTIVGDPIAVGQAANGLAFGPGGTTLYVTSRDAGRVTAVSTATFSATRTYDIGGMPQRIAVSPDGSTLYVANEVSGLDVVDVETGEFESIDFGTAGYGLGMTPDGAHLYVLLAQAGAVVVLDRESLEPVTTLETGGIPRNVTFDAAGETAIIATEESVVFVK